MAFANPIIAHRGWSGRAPENTLAAIRMAFEAPYVTGVELDVQLTKDKVPVVIHDFTLDRTTTGRGPVRAHTYDQLRALDAGSWFAPSFRGERIPTLAEALEAAKGGGIVNIELKTAGGPDAELAGRVVEAVRSAGMARDVFLTSFDHATMRLVSLLAPEMETGLLFGGRPVSWKARLKAAGAKRLSIAHRHLTKRLAEEAREAGIELMAWTVDDPAEIRRVAGLGGDIMICTNHPDRAAAALGR